MPTVVFSTIPPCLLPCRPFHRNIQVTVASTAAQKVCYTIDTEHLSLVQQTINSQTLDPRIHVQISCVLRRPDMQCRCCEYSVYTVQVHKQSHNTTSTSGITERLDNRHWTIVIQYNFQAISTHSDISVNLQKGEEQDTAVDWQIAEV